MASTLRVPAEYATIQSALDGTASGDTVLVDVGTYAESVIMPFRFVVLKGNVETDTGMYQRPVIDPSTLGNPRTRRCMTTTGPFGSIVEDFVFRNGPEMFPRGPFDIGGIHHFDSAGVFKRCVWDSTYVGIRAEHALRLDECTFVDNLWVCLDATGVALTANNTSFHGRTGGWAVLEFGTGSNLRNCRVTTVGEGRNVLAEGDLITISNCDFGYFEPSGVPFVQIEGRANLIDSCLFHDCHVTTSILHVTSLCEYPTVVQNCTFYNNYLPFNWNSPSRWMMRAISGVDMPNCFGVEVLNNTFRDARREHGARAMSIRGQVFVSGNRITQTVGDETPSILCLATGAVLRDNLIYGNGQGVGTQDPAWCDARFNWWGDSTGPYNSNSNPFGLGDTVGVNVDFFPWHTDTLFMASVHEPRPPLPERASLLAYPNPFNSVTTIQLTLPRSGIARIELFDIMGRRVKELWSGSVGETRDIQFNASEFASGIYFVRAWDPLGNRLYAATKVVLLK